VENPLPSSTSADEGKVLKVDSNGDPTWATGGGGSSYTAGNGIDITNDEISVDTSVVATQTDLSGKQDTLTAGTNVSISNNVISATDTTYSAGTGIDITNNEISVETPVDIVAGPGIVIDNPDGNTLRVSVAQTNEVELYKHTTVAQTNVNDVYTMSEPITNFDRIRIEFWNREFQYQRISFEYDVADAVADSTLFIAALDASAGTSNIQRMNMAVGFNSAGNLVDKFHGLFFGNGSSYTNAANRGLGIHRVIGIHRINGGN
jgi:hypothetical protein